jgi:hypothetical protein
MDQAPPAQGMTCPTRKTLALSILKSAMTRSATTPETYPVEYRRYTLFVGPERFKIGL